MVRFVTRLLQYTNVCTMFGALTASQLLLVVFFTSSFQLYFISAIFLFPRVETHLSVLYFLAVLADPDRVGGDSRRVMAGLCSFLYFPVGANCVAGNNPKLVYLRSTLKPLGVHWIRYSGKGVLALSLIDQRVRPWLLVFVAKVKADLF